MKCKLQNTQTTARGTSIVNVFVQEDLIITPAKRETMLINPVILGEENANTFYQASRAGEAGLLLDTILAALQGIPALATLKADGDAALHGTVKEVETFFTEEERSRQGQDCVICSFGVTKTL